ncbi:hypothetical protein C7120_09050 [Prevotella sp. oral taxon 376]|uniref:hypothetical protein n=1 Tax=Prevotella sp. oral taxon 376 TaxID=712466 RepID=UPI000D1F59A9|nr:hypothetical protein [Prevotella sp. oral taxon 376]PTL34637.1 hypothetical protein C7120_09050 [Prevotella sp. oral taxon 376]
MRKIFLILSATIFLISCGSSYERKVKAAFKSYVSTHFDNPKDLKEIVAIDSCDTISIKEVQDLLKSTKTTYDSINKVVKERAEKISKSLKNPKLRGLTHRNPYFNEAIHKYNEASMERLSLTSSDLSWALYDIGKPLEDRYKDFMSKRGKTYVQCKIHVRVAREEKDRMVTYYAISDTLLNNIEIRSKGIGTEEVLGADNLIDFSEISDEYLSRIKNAKELDEYGKIVLNIINREI